MLTARDRNADIWMAGNPRRRIPFRVHTYCAYLATWIARVAPGDLLVADDARTYRYLDHADWRDEVSGDRLRAGPWSVETRGGRSLGLRVHAEGRGLALEFANACQPIYEFMDSVCDSPDVRIVEGWLKECGTVRRRCSLASGSCGAVGEWPAWASSGWWSSIDISGTDSGACRADGESVRAFPGRVPAWERR
jgi:hypothetical protein